MPIATELHNALVELFNATNNPDIISRRDGYIGVLSTAESQGQINAAWQAILHALNPAYYVARDNTKKFYTVKPHIKALEVAASYARLALDGKIGANQTLATHLVQFIFKVSNFYSIASTLDADNFDKCTVWLNIARTLIHTNGLENTMQHAIWENLMGGHKSRAYQMGRDVSRPQAATEHFVRAVSIHRQLRSRYNNPNDVEYRHVTMCCASTMLQEAMWLVLNEGFPSAMTTVLIHINNAENLLANLTDANLVNKDGSPDLYRRAGREQCYGYMNMLRGNFDEAAAAMNRAVDLMRAAIGATGATGQLSAILNDQAEALIALAHVRGNDLPLIQARASLEASIRISEGQFEQMYADNAKRSLAQLNANVAKHRATKLAAAIPVPGTVLMPNVSNVTFANLIDELPDEEPAAAPVAAAPEVVAAAAPGQRATLRS